ncbi:MAG: class I SAM-dependent methyltransferase [Chloroflexi bacterium]|nr:class I SAM-dependent methyltransferase [Chloroflexota bacterium]
MERVTDWAALWRQLAETRYWRGFNRPETAQAVDTWRDKAREFDEKIKRRWTRPDSSRTLLLSQVDAETTVLDIGAGTGRWAMLLAPHVRWVTAIEPAPAMAELMAENLAREGIKNVHIVQDLWPTVSVEPHDVSLCAHGMYSSPDLPAFIRAMVQATKRTCYLILRAPALDGPMSQIARHLWGQPHSSPNFVIAYNVLLEMGILAHVLIEDSGWWEAESHASLEEALADVKRRFGLGDSMEHDGYLLELLKEHLTFQDGRYVWPPEVRSALVYWNVVARSRSV